MVGRRSRSGSPNPPGAHFLRTPVAHALVRAARVRPTDLVLDLGAGTGQLTAPLAATGARVIAVERDPALARRLTSRFAGDPRVSVSTADLLRVGLPRTGYRVVANLPFAVTTALLGRLLDPAGSSLIRADLVVQWGAAKGLTACRPADPRVLWWACRYEFRLARRLDPGAFVPPPSVSAAVLTVRYRPLADPDALSALPGLLKRGYRSRSTPVGRALSGPLTHRQVATAVPPNTPVRDLTAADWANLASATVRYGIRR